MKTKIRLFLKFLLFFIVGSWFLHTLAKNFIVDPDFKKFLGEKVAPPVGIIWLTALHLHIILALSALSALVAGAFDFLRNVKGSGLGLSLVKHIAEAHGGNALVNSVLNRGNTFTITLPIINPNDKAKTELKIL